tara:strand:- start:691 stop:2118 length:1428 start_codon:yes stop_codon:yes gene_type:complete
MAIDQVTTGIIKDDAVTAAKIVAGAVVADIATGGVTTAKLADDAVTQAKMGAGAIGTTELAADAVDGTKLADNAVNSEHVTAGAIDTAHVGDDQITGAKIENNPTIAGKLTVAGDFIPSAPLSHRNIVINGAMLVAQRGTSSTSTGGSGFYHTADRMFNFDNCVAANFTRESTSGVLGTEASNTFKDVFPYSWKFASNGTVGSIPAADRVFFAYKMEGQDVQHLLKGTASARPVTLSFYVKSTQTGNHQVNLCDNTNTRMIGATYTVSSASTWEKKVITFAGDTTGALANSTANALSLEWWLTAGANYTGGAVPTSWEANAATDRAAVQQNYVGGSGRVWQITGIQLELGSNATPYEHKTFGEELVRCERYYQQSEGDDWYALGHNEKNADNKRVLQSHEFKNEMRATPTVVISRGGVVGDTFLDNWGIGNTGTCDGIYAPWITRKHFTTGWSGTETAHQPHNLISYKWTSDIEL